MKYFIVKKESLYLKIGNLLQDKKITIYISTLTDGNQTLMCKFFISKLVLFLFIFQVTLVVTL